LGVKGSPIAVSEEGEDVLAREASMGESRLENFGGEGGNSGRHESRGKNGNEMM
jgi:hypothetical protein